MKKLKQIPRDELEAAFEQAAAIINWMAPHVGRMAPPDDGIMALNEHWLFCQRTDVAQKRLPETGAPLDQPKVEGVRP